MTSSGPGAFSGSSGQREDGLTGNEGRPPGPDAAFRSDWCVLKRPEDIAAFWLDKERARSALLEAAIRHVLRHGKLGKQSESRLRAALRAVEVSRGT